MPLEQQLAERLAAAYEVGDTATVNQLLQENQVTEGDVQSFWGFTPDQTSGLGVNFYTAPPAASSPTIESLYQDILGRAPDPEGLAYWQNTFGTSIDPSEVATFRTAAAPELASMNAGVAPPAPTAAPAFSSTAERLASVGLIKDYEGKEYNASDLYGLADQISRSLDRSNLAGGVYGTQGESVGFDYSEAARILGRDPTAADQVALDMARQLMNQGVKNLDDLTIATTGREAFMRDEDLVDYSGRVGSNRNVGTDWRTKLLESGTGGTFGETYTGPGGTKYYVFADPTTGKPVFTTADFSTSDADVLGYLLTIGSFAFPGLGNTLTSTISSALPGAATATTAATTFNTIASSALSSGVMSGVSAVAAGGDFGDGFTSGFLSGGLGAGVRAVVPTDFIKTNPIFANGLINAGTAAITAAATGQDVGDALTRSLLNTTVNTGVGALANSQGLTKEQTDAIVKVAAPIITSLVQNGKVDDGTILNAVLSGVGTMINSGALADKGLTNNTAKVSSQGSSDTASQGTPTVTGVRFGESDEVAFEAYRGAMAAGMTSDEAWAVANYLTSPQGKATYQDTLAATGDPNAALDAVVDATGKAGTQAIRTGSVTGTDIGLAEDAGEGIGLSAAQADATQRNTVVIGNAEADTPQEAAALAKAKDPTAMYFTYGGQTYTMSASTEQVARQIDLQDIQNAPTFNEAYSKARDLLGPNKTFEWQGKQYSTATFGERPDLAGTDVVPGATSTTAGAGRGSYAGFDPVAAAEAAVKTPISSTISDKGPTIFGIPIGTPQDAINTVKRMGEVVADFSKGIGEGGGNFIKFFGDLGHIASASLAGGDPKDATITKNNLLSSIGADVGNYYKSLTSAESNAQWNNFVKDVSAAPDYLKPFVAVGSALQNFGGVINKVGVEAGEDVAPILAGLGIGSKLLQLGTSGTIKTVAVTATLGDMAESMTGSYNNVMDRLKGNTTMTEAEKHWAATQAGAASMAATAVFGYGANAYLAKSLVGDFVENAAKKVMGNAYIEYATEFPETLIQSLSETYAVKGSIEPADVSRANTDASISSLIGAKTAGSIVGSAEVMGHITNEFVGASSGDRTGLAVIQNADGQIAYVPAGDLKVGDTVNAESLTQLQTPAEIVSQFNFSPEEESRVISSVEQLDATRDERQQQTEIEKQEYESQVASAETTQGTSDTGAAADTKAATGTGSAVDTSSQAGVNTDIGSTTSATTDPNTGVTTQTAVNSQTGVTTQTATDPNTNVTTQTQTDPNTNTSTTTEVNPNTNTNTQTTVNSETNVSTQTTVNTETNVTTQVTTDPNTNTQTTVNTDPNTNTQVTTVINVNTGEVIDRTEGPIPDKWEPPVIDVVPPPPAPPPGGETLPPGEPPKIKTEKTTRTPRTPRTPSPPTPPTPPGMFFGGQLAPFPPVQFPGLNIPILQPEASKFYKEKKIDPLEQVMQAQADFMKEPQMQQFAQPAPQPQQQSSPLDMLRQLQSGQSPSGQLPDQEKANPYYSYGSERPIEEILAGMGTREMAAGGYVAPLMAQGGMALPLMAKKGGALSHYEGRENFKEGKHVAGEGDGQSDDIPAWLADGEFVFPADVVSALGNGSTKAGTDKLYEMMHSIRDRARSKGPKDLPPPAFKSPLDYLKSRKGAR